jgi:hypothetical protein
MQPEFKRKYLKGLQKKETTYEETVANMWHYVWSVGIFFTVIDTSLWVQMCLIMLAETGQTNLTDNNPGLTSDEARLEVDFSYDKQTENCLHIEHLVSSYSDSPHSHFRLNHLTLKWKVLLYTVIFWTVRRLRSDQESDLT